MSKMLKAQKAKMAKKKREANLTTTDQREAAAHMEANMQDVRAVTASTGPASNMRIATASGLRHVRSGYDTAAIVSADDSMTLSTARTSVPIGFPKNTTIPQVADLQPGRPNDVASAVPWKMLRQDLQTMRSNNFVQEALKASPDAVAPMTKLDVLGAGQYVHNTPADDEMKILLFLATHKPANGGYLDGVVYMKGVDENGEEHSVTLSYGTELKEGFSGDLVRPDLHGEKLVHIFDLNKAMKASLRNNNGCHVSTITPTMILVSLSSYGSGFQTNRTTMEKALHLQSAADLMTAYVVIDNVASENRCGSRFQDCSDTAIIGTIPVLTAAEQCMNQMSAHLCQITIRSLKANSSEDSAYAILARPHIHPTGIRGTELPSCSTHRTTRTAIAEAMQKLSIHTDPSGQYLCDLNPPSEAEPCIALQLLNNGIVPIVLEPGVIRLRLGDMYYPHKISAAHPVPDSLKPFTSTAACLYVPSDGQGNFSDDEDVVVGHWLTSSKMLCPHLDGFHFDPGLAFMMLCYSFPGASFIPHPDFKWQSYYAEDTIMPQITDPEIAGKVRECMTECERLSAEVSNTAPMMDSILGDAHSPKRKLYVYSSQLHILRTLTDQLLKLAEEKGLPEGSPVHRLVEKFEQYKDPDFALLWAEAARNASTHFDARDWKAEKETREEEMQKAAQIAPLFISIGEALTNDDVFPTDETMQELFAQVNRCFGLHGCPPPASLFGLTELYISDFLTHLVTLLSGIRPLMRSGAWLDCEVLALRNGIQAVWWVLCQKVTKTAWAPVSTDGQHVFVGNSILPCGLKFWREPDLSQLPASSQWPNLISAVDYQDLDRAILGGHSSLAATVPLTSNDTRHQIRNSARFADVKSLVIWMFKQVKKQRAGANARTIADQSLHLSPDAVVSIRELLTDMTSVAALQALQARLDHLCEKGDITLTETEFIATDKCYDPSTKAINIPIIEADDCADNLELQAVAAADGPWQHPNMFAAVNAINELEGFDKEQAIVLVSMLSATQLLGHGVRKALAVLTMGVISNSGALGMNATAALLYFACVDGVPAFTCKEANSLMKLGHISLFCLLGVALVAPALYLRGIAETPTLKQLLDAFHDAISRDVQQADTEHKQQVEKTLTLTQKAKDAEERMQCTSDAGEKYTVDLCYNCTMVLVEGCPNGCVHYYRSCIQRNVTPKAEVLLKGITACKDCEQLCCKSRLIDGKCSSCWKSSPLSNADDCRIWAAEKAQQQAEPVKQFSLVAPPFFQKDPAPHQMSMAMVLAIDPQKNQLWVAYLDNAAHNSSNYTPKALQILQALVNKEITPPQITSFPDIKNLAQSLEQKWPMAKDLCTYVLDGLHKATCIEASPTAEQLAKLVDCFQMSNATHSGVVFDSLDEAFALRHAMLTEAREILLPSEAVARPKLAVLSAELFQSDEMTSERHAAANKARAAALEAERVQTEKADALQKKQETLLQVEAMQLSASEATILVQCESIILPAAPESIILPAAPESIILPAAAEAAPKACAICLDEDVELLVFVPCGHKSCCGGCIDRLQCQAAEGWEEATCPICREPFERAMRVFD